MVPMGFTIIIYSCFRLKIGNAKLAPHHWTTNHIHWDSIAQYQLEVSVLKGTTGYASGLDCRLTQI